LGAFFAGILAFGPVTAFAEEWKCLNDKDGLAAFNSGDMKRAPGYTEPKSGGTRVQREHPKTFMFGQSRFLKGKLSSNAVCQYTNHVGAVAYYIIQNVETVDVLEACETETCKSKPHWRSEWVVSNPDDASKGYELYVCIESGEGYDWASTACKFTGFEN